MANRTSRVVRDEGALVVLDGEGGFGQVIGERAVDLAIAKAQVFDLGLVALRDSGHLGRIGGWAERAAAARMASLHFVNSPGHEGAQVAPFGTREQRLAPNPLAIAIPRPGAPPVLMDITTSVVPEGG